MMDDGPDRVVPLRQLDDFTVADGDPDVRGWDVVAADGRKLGDVDELLVDTNAMKVRYLDVEVEDGLVAQGGDSHLLVPIGYARLERDGHRVVVDNLSSADLAGIPLYDRQPLTRDFETRLRDSFSGRRAATDTAVTDDLSTGTARTEGRFYDDRSFDDDRFFGRERTGDEQRLTLSEEQLAVDRREVETGRVEVGKHVETRHVSESVPTMHEEVTVERRPITDPMAAGTTRIEGDEVRIPIREEEVVVEKRVVPKEELVVRKHQVVEERPVEAELRRERVDVRESGEVDLRGDVGPRNDRGDDRAV